MPNLAAGHAAWRSTLRTRGRAPAACPPGRTLSVASRRRRRFPGTVRGALLAFLPLAIAAMAAPADNSEPRGLGTDRSPTEFFRDKFACVRWVTRKAPDSKCLECHAAILKANDLPTREGLPSGVTGIHAQHLRSGKVKFTCLTCHQSLDPYQASAAGIRNQVSANRCFKCHFPHGQK